MANDFFQVPVVSNGLRMVSDFVDRVPYHNGTIAFAVGDVVTGDTSSRVGTVVHVDGTTAAGTLYIENTTVGGGNYTDGENLQVSAATNATANNDSNDLYTQGVTAVGQNNPKHGQFCDQYGQAYVRFGEGAPQLDAFGKMQVSLSSSIGEYLNHYDILEDKYEKTETGGGTAVHQPNHAGALLTCGTVSGDVASLVSHRYHKYMLGQSHLIEMTCAIGDTGKANVDRTFGYGDGDNGVFFRLTGTTFQVMVRDKTSGSVVTTAVDQADWSTDKLDGTGLSGLTLDVTNANIYWIDFQWLGAGRIRFGIMQNGRRILCHEINNGNQNSLPYMATATLPVCWSQENTGTAGSTSEMRLWCATVKTEGEFTPPKLAYSFGGATAFSVDNTMIPIASFRCKQTLNSVNNRTIAFGKTIHGLPVTEAVLVQLVKNPTTLTGATWAVDPHVTSGVEADTAATVVAGGRVLDSYIFDAGVAKDVDMSSIFNILAEALTRHATITNTDVFTIQAQRLTGASATDFYMTASWEEVQ